MDSIQEILRSVITEYLRYYIPTQLNEEKESLVKDKVTIWVPTPCFKLDNTDEIDERELLKGNKFRARPKGDFTTIPNNFDGTNPHNKYRLVHVELLMQFNAHKDSFEVVEVKYFTYSLQS